MAGLGDAMEDLEDGELSGSNSDPEIGTTAVDARPQAATASIFSGQSFQSRAPAQPSATSYRGAAKAADSSDSDEEAALWRHKRQKVSNTLPPPTPMPPAPTATYRGPAESQGGIPNLQGGRKINNIWGSVVQEQTQEAVAAELGVFGMEGDISMSERNVETYNYVLARKMMAKEKEEEEQAKNEGEVCMLDDQLEQYMKGRGGPADSTGGHSKRKRAVKDRLGQRAEMDIKGRYEITEDDPEDRVIDEIAHRLREPKRELMERVVTVIGRKKAIELLGETATLEETGGVYTMGIVVVKLTTQIFVALHPIDGFKDGSRRRTPGGVFLNLLKNTPSITSEQVKEIFYDETQKECKSKKAAQKRRRHMVAKKMKQAINTLNLQEHDDVSRETFASDTNEALESLEEVADEETPLEPASGTEETPVVYNSADLEVF